MTQGGAVINNLLNSSLGSLEFTRRLPTERASAGVVEDEAAGTCHGKKPSPFRTPRAVHKGTSGCLDLLNLALGQVLTLLVRLRTAMGNCPLTHHVLHACAHRSSSSVHIFPRIEDFIVDEVFLFAMK